MKIRNSLSCIHVYNNYFGCDNCCDSALFNSGKWDKGILYNIFINLFLIVIPDQLDLSKYDDRKKK